MNEWGYIPQLLSLDDPRPAEEQFNENYAFGGFRRFEGFKFNPITLQLRYPGDPPMKPIAMMPFRDERIFLYRGAWVLILQKDGSWAIARMD